MIRKLILLFLLYSSSYGQFNNLGGSLQSEIKARHCNCRAATKEEFLQAMLQDTCKKVWIAAPIDFSGTTEPIIINHTLASNGKTIYSTTLTKLPAGQLENCILFITGKDSIRITGINFLGANGEIGDPDYSAHGQQGLIRVDHNYFTFDNNAVRNFDTWGVWLNCGTGHLIRNNTFTGIRRTGYGYSIWMGGCGNHTGTCIIENNIFEKTRHAVASSGHLNFWEVKYNLFTGNASNHQLDRHNKETICYGGKGCSIHHNIFYTRNRHFGLQWPQDSSGDIEIYENYFTQDSLNTGTVCDSLWYKLPHERISVHDNFYNRVNIDSAGIQLPPPYQQPIVDTLPRLTFRYKDSYWGEQKNRLKIQVYADQSLLMNKDIAKTGKTWQTGNVLIPEGTDTIRIRFYCNKPPVGSISLWLDDVTYKGSIQSFEGELLPWKQRFSFRPPGTSQVGTGNRTDDSYSGDYSWRFTYSGKYQPGQWAEIYLTL